MHQLRQKYGHLSARHQKAKTRRQAFAKTIEKLADGDPGKDRKAGFLKKQIDSIDKQLHTQYRVDILAMQAGIAALQTETETLRQFCNLQ